jgi:asparagine synthase (glutamine-hydrolysing)
MAIIVDFVERKVTHTSSIQNNTQPLPETNILLDCQARIDNLSELKSLLGLNNTIAHSITTQDLLLMAFEYWNVGMFRYIRGDWRLAIWDERKQSVILAIDPTSPTSLFYAWTTNGQLAFSDSPTDLLSTEGISRELHEARVLSYILNWLCYNDFLQTEYKSIRQIGSATFNIFKSGKVQTETFWQATQFQIKQASSSEEYVEEFLRLYQQAVISRLPRSGNVASMLSAGLDSGSVTALAARALLTEEREVYAYTHVPVQEAQNLCLPGTLVNEWPAACKLASMYPNTKHMAVQSDHLNPITAMVLMLETTSRMQAANQNATWIHHLYQTVKNDGFDTLLSGQAGNITVSWNGGRVNFWDLLLRKEWAQASHYLRHNQKSLPAKLKTLAGDTLRKINPDRDFPTRLFTPALTAIANPDICQHWKSRFEGEFLLSPAPTTNHRQFRNHMFPMLTTAHSFGQLIARTYGVTLTDPTSDQSVFEWCLQVPDREFINSAQSRLLIRNAMQGIIPESTRTSNLRGLQPADLGYRYTKYGETVDYVLTLMRSSPSIAYYLNLNVIKKAWQGVRATKLPDRNLADFHRGLQAGLFFLVYEGKISSHDF